MIEFFCCVNILKMQPSVNHPWRCPCIWPCPALAAAPGSCSWPRRTGCCSTRPGCPQWTRSKTSWRIQPCKDIIIYRISNISFNLLVTPKMASALNVMLCILRDKMNCTVWFGICFLRVPQMHQPCCLVPLCWGKLEEIKKKQFTGSSRHLRTMLPGSRSWPWPPKGPKHATWPLFHSKSRKKTYSTDHFVS